MQWARDAVADRAALIRSVTSLLTATTRVMVAGMDADPTVVLVPQTSLDVVAPATGILTMTGGDVAIAIETAIGAGAATGRSFSRKGAKKAKKTPKLFTSFFAIFAPLRETAVGILDTI
jgi:hypothetical protein